MHKVPVGDTLYVITENVQLVDKDPERAIPLFSAAINARDRVDSALKDMAIVMKLLKLLNRFKVDAQIKHKYLLIISSWIFTRGVGDLMTKLLSSSIGCT